MQRHSIRFPLPDGVAAEEMTLQMIQRALSLPGKIGKAALRARFAGHAHQPLFLHGGILKLPPAALAQQRHRYAAAPPQR